MSSYKGLNFCDKERFKRVVLSNCVVYTFKRKKDLFNIYCRIERVNFKDKSVFYAVGWKDNKFLINDIIFAKRTINEKVFKSWLKNLELNGFKGCLNE